MSRRFWIVCLMLALLPLRGWAAASMPVETARLEASVAQADAPPCHQSSAESPAPMCQACDLCALCHAVLAATQALPALAAPAIGPAVLTAHDTGRRITGGLERPPRHVLA